MQAQKPTMHSTNPAAQTFPPFPASSDPRELHAATAARPSRPLPHSERLAGPFKVKPSYLERRAWPFGG